jgi:hypothetical protein
MLALAASHATWGGGNYGYLLWIGWSQRIRLIYQTTDDFLERIAFPLALPMVKWSTRSQPEWIRLPDPQIRRHDLLLGFAKGGCRFDIQTWITDLYQKLVRRISYSWSVNLNMMCFCRSRFSVDGTSGRIAPSFSVSHVKVLEKLKLYSSVRQHVMTIL